MIEFKKKKLKKKVAWGHPAGFEEEGAAGKIWIIAQLSYSPGSLTPEQK